LDFTIWGPKERKIISSPRNIKHTPYNVCLWLEGWYPIVRICLLLVQYHAVCGGEPLLWVFFSRFVFSFFFQMFYCLSYFYLLCLVLFYLVHFIYFYFNFNYFLFLFSLFIFILFLFLFIYYCFTVLIASISLINYPMSGSVPQ
jgi:hypothetical protein